MACAAEPEPRPQLVVLVDTDAPVLGQLGDNDGHAPAVAIDTVRIDVLSGDRDVTNYRDVTAPDPHDWPLSFGVAAQSGTPPTLRLRIRAFKAAFASRGTLDGVTTLEPSTNLLIDRIVDVEQPTSGIRTVRVLLATACFGAPASFETPAHTCVDRDRRNASPAEGVLEPAASSLVGTAPEALEHGCTSAPKSGARCIPGGASVLGDPRVAGLLNGPAPIPQRPVLVSAFHMDTTEFTVGRYRKLLEQGLVDEVPRAKGADGDPSSACTWLSPTDANNDSYPLNCISYDAAARACAAEGGRLPTEAQWEHAARGRGRGYLYPWGDGAPDCCSASMARTADGNGTDLMCGAGAGVEPVASHTDAKCPVVDVSLDGIIDLGGSLQEATADGGKSFADRCWQGPGLVLDPVCTDPSLNGIASARGGEWSAGRTLMASALRHSLVFPSITAGFRCVYADAP